MKVYVTARFKDGENRDEIEALCEAVRGAKLVDFNFARDVEQYKHTFDDSQELWERARDEIIACDGLLIDVSDHPTGGRLVEVGIAYAKQMPIIVTKRQGTTHKDMFEGIASVIIEYTDHKDLTRQLKDYDSERSFTVNDRLTMLVSILAVGAVTAYMVAQFFVPLALLWLIVYWFVVRRLFPVMRPFDRVVIYIPLIAIWLGGLYVLMPIYVPLALAWAIGFWIIVVVVLNKLKFSL